MIKNRAIYGFPFLLINKSDGSPVTTGTPSGYVTLDDGDQAALTGSFAHKGNGQWAVDEITAAEMNGDVIGLLFMHDDAISVHYAIKTSEPSAGTGSIAWTYTLTEPPAIPIADAEVWITTDIGGANIIASGRTDQYGAVTFYLNAGTVYVWCRKSGYTFTNPDTEVVS